MIENKTNLRLNEVSPPNYMSMVEGNSNLETAQVIGLAEIHPVPSNVRRICRFIRQQARPGDILLIEGITGGQAVTTTDLKNSKDHNDYNFPNTVHIEGWDDMEARQQYIQMVKEYEKGNISRSDVEPQLDLLSAKRNQCMLEIIQRVRQEFPGKRIFVIAGASHFRTDPAVKLGLEQYAYAILSPKKNIADKMGRIMPFIQASRDRRYAAKKLS